MKHAHAFAFFLLFFLLSSAANGQEPFQNCSAAFLNNRMVVNEYSPDGRCTLPANASGELVVGTVDLSPNGSKLVDKILFQVAIRDQTSKTLVMYSNKTYRQISIEKVLAECRPGDHIVLLTLENRYALPHNEILVN